MINYPKLNHISRYLYSWIRIADITIIGQFHGANYGDYLMGKALEVYLAGKGYKPVRLTLNSLSKWKNFKSKPVLIGGGNLLYEDNLYQLKHYLNKCSSKFGFIGVDFVELNTILQHRDLFEKANFISFRSEIQARKFKSLIKSNSLSVHHHPDIAFLYSKSVSQSTVNKTQSKTVGINVLPLYQSYENNKFQINVEKNFYEQAKKEVTAYELIIRNIVDQYLERGWRVVHQPFTFEDELYAKELFYKQSQDIKLLPYTISRRKNFQQLKCLHRFIPSRFHAHVLGILAGVPMTPIPYAEKCKDLLLSLGCSEFAKYTPNYFCENTDEFLRDLFYLKPIFLGNTRVNEIQDITQRRIDSLINSIIY